MFGEIKCRCKDGDGDIDIEEIRQIMDGCGALGVNGEDPDGIIEKFSQMDDDGNGTPSG